MSTLEQLRKIFEGKRLIIPIVLGLGVAVFMLARDFDYQSLKDFSWGDNASLFIFLAVLMMVFRDLGYMLRLRILSDKQLSWKQSFQLTFLWEFASAISPGIVGGTAAAFVLLAQEKIGTGRSTAIVLATSFLDVMFYIITVPLIILFTGFTEHIPEIEVSNGTIHQDFLVGYIIISYSILLVWAVVVFFGLLVKPQWIKQIIKGLFSLPLLNRWKAEANGWGDELVVSSHEFSRKGFRFWLSAYGATFFSWIARFAVVNFIILAAGPATEHFEILTRQLLMWCILLLPFTPGASGLAEAIFPAFLSKFFPTLTLSKIGALVWRLLSYYPYLIIGFILFPVWIRRIIKLHHKPPTTQLQEEN